MSRRNTGNWRIAKGTYRIAVGKSAHDLPLTADTALPRREVPFALGSADVLGVVRHLPGPHQPESHVLWRFRLFSGSTAQHPAPR